MLLLWTALFGILLFANHASTQEYKVFKQEKGLTVEDKTYLLNRHNTYRRLVATGHGYVAGRTAANMNYLEWNEGLAATAQKHAEDCTGPSHDKEANRLVGTTFATVGQNMMDCSRTMDCAGAAMANFAVEGKGFSYSKVKNSDSCDETKNVAGTCGHYLQLIWAATSYVGCGYSKCTGKGKYARLVCNYGEAGVYKFKEPFITGAVCSQCSIKKAFCFKGLCATKAVVSQIKDASQYKCSISASACKANGGTFSADECFCQCPASKGGKLCEKKCSDLAGATCITYKKLGYCKGNFAAWAAINCQASCGVCTAAAKLHKATPLAVLPDARHLPEQAGGKKECRKGKGMEYNGKVAVGHGGVSCTNWADSKFAKHKVEKNYCRNPDGSAYPWCPTANAAGFAYCEIRPCAST